MSAINGYDLADDARDLYFYIFKNTYDYVHDTKFCNKSSLQRGAVMLNNLNYLNGKNSFMFVKILECHTSK